MPSANGFGITLVADTLAESVDVSFETDVKVLIDKSGEFSQAQVYDVTGTFSVKGSGTTSIAVGSASGAPSNLSGKVIVTSVKKSQSNEDFEKFEYSGTCYLSAS
jgi:hypothetical protein